MSGSPGHPPEARVLNRFGWEKKLRKTDDFSSVFRFKRARRGRYLDVFACPNTLAYPRLGLIVGKKVLPRAVDRNRVKRILRECFRHLQRELSGLDVVFRLKAAGDAAAYRGECEQLLAAIRQKIAKQQATTPIGSERSEQPTMTDKDE